MFTFHADVTTNKYYNCALLGIVSSVPIGHPSLASNLPPSRYLKVLCLVQLHTWLSPLIFNPVALPVLFLRVLGTRVSHISFVTAHAEPQTVSGYCSTPFKMMIACRTLTVDCSAIISYSMRQCAYLNSRTYKGCAVAQHCCYGDQPFNGRYQSLNLCISLTP